MDITLYEPNWLVLLLIGTLIAPASIYSWRFVIFIFSKKDKFSIDGVWYSAAPYFEPEKSGYRHYNWSIKKVWYNKDYFAKAISKSNKKMVYTGPVKLEREFLIFELSAKHDDEAVYIRVKRGSPEIQKEMVGISLKHEDNGGASAGPIIFSREQMNNSQICLALDLKCKANTNSKVIKLHEE